MQQKQPHDWWKTFRKWLKTAWDTVKKFLIQVYPGRKVWLGAGLGIGITGYLFLILMAVDVFLPVGWGYFLLILILMPLVVSLVAAILIGLGRVLFRLPAIFLILLATGVVLIVVSFSHFNLAGVLFWGVVIILGGLLGAAASVLIRGRWEHLPPCGRSLWLRGRFWGWWVWFLWSSG